jgi:tRNA threonylcarbamoyladenosine biosynthesis protein TsaB
MRLLAFDTSTECCSVALLLGDELRLRSEITARGHAELVLPMADALLAEAGLALRDLDGLAFGCGPGAFTGLRIAAGLVQGLALGAGLQVAPVSSLAALAVQVAAGPGELVLACNDARMGEVYWAAYRRGAGADLEACTPERVSPPPRVGENLPGLAHAAGNALAAHPELAVRLEGLGLRLHHGLYPRADAVARLAVRSFESGATVAAGLALPVYVRDEVARPPGATVTGMQ